MKFSQSKKKWLIVGTSLFGISLITAGVFASTQITLNSGNAVSLGAGSASVNVCGTSATVSAQQSFDSTAQAYLTTTVSITGVSANCAGKTLSMAFKTGSTINSATWAVPAGYTDPTQKFNYGYGSRGATAYDAQTALTAFDTYGSNLSTIAVAAQ